MARCREASPPAGPSPLPPWAVLAGHSRGGAIATLAAGDAVTDQRSTLGLITTFHRVKLYTFGQPRVADKAYAAMLEEHIGERFRMVNR